MRISDWSSDVCSSDLQGQNAGLAFIKLKDWKDRSSSENKAQALVGRAMGVFSKYRDATIFALMPPAVRELGNATGFDLWLVDNTNMGHEKLLGARNQLLGMAAGDKGAAQVRPATPADATNTAVAIDPDKADAPGPPPGPQT